MADCLSPITDKLKDQITCSVCLGHYTDPRTLPCHHSFCKHCIDGLQTKIRESDKLLICPTCRNSAAMPEIGANGFPTAFLINSLLELAGSLEQSSPKRRNSFNPKQDESHLCQRHNKPMEVFCESCEELICQHCTFKDHRDHEYDSITAVFDKHKKELEVVYEQNEEIVKANSKMEHLENEALKITEEKTEISESIDTWVEQLHRALDNSRESMKSELTENVQKMLQVVSREKTTLKSAVSALEDKRNHLIQLLDTQCLEAILAKKSTLVKSINRRKLLLTDLITLQQPNRGFLYFDMNYVSLEQFGDVGSTLVIKPDGFVASGKGCKSAMVGKEESFELKITNEGGTIPQHLVKCQLYSPNSTNAIECEVASSQDGQYKISYTPLTYGPHQIKLLVKGIEVPGDYIKVRVLPSPDMRGKSFKAMSVARQPFGLAITKTGQIIVASKDGYISLLNSKGYAVWSLQILGVKMPTGVAIQNDDEYILLVDSHENQLIALSMEGKETSRVGKKGSGELQFNGAISVGIHPDSGQVFVCDTGNHRIQVLNGDLSYSRMFGKKGKGNGQFLTPVDVAFDSAGVVYVTDFERKDIQKFTPLGKFLHSFSLPTSDTPVRICIDSNDIMYVVSVKVRGIPHVLMMVSSGTLSVCLLSCHGDAIRKFTIPDLASCCGIKVNQNGALFINDFVNKHLVTF